VFSVIHKAIRDGSALWKTAFTAGDPAAQAHGAIERRPHTRRYNERHHTTAPGAADPGGTAPQTARGPHRARPAGHHRHEVTVRPQRRLAPEQRDTGQTLALTAHVWHRNETARGAPRCPHGQPATSGTR
jgi:hypothetical protein